MGLDPRKFHNMLVADTCSVWNLLSSRKLFRAACSAKVYFCITPMVLYECLYKPRKSITKEQEELINRFGSARRTGLFNTQACELDDLLTVTKGAPAGLGSGELSCIATAFKLTTLGVMTDERLARRYAEQSLRLIVETTPKLYAWLHYNRYLTDADHGDVVSEHEIYERRPLSQFFNEAYEAALQYQLNPRLNSEG